MIVSLKDRNFVCMKQETFSKDPRTTSSSFKHPSVLAEIQYCIVSILQVFISYSSCQALCQGLRTQTNPKVRV